MTSIRILDPEAWQIEAYGIDGGKVFVDVGEEFNIRLTKSLEELTEAEKIAREASLSGTVPATQKNKALFAKYSANVWRRSREVFSMRVEVKHEGEQINVTRATVKQLNDRQQQFEIELFGGGWIDDLERTLVRDLDLGLFVYSKIGVDLAWANQEAPAVPVLADYGGWWQEGEVSRKDLRMWFNLRYVLEQAFCQATNYLLESTYLQGPAGKSLYAYLSPERWYSYREKQDPLRVALEIASPKQFTGNPDSNIWDEVFDPFDLWDSAFGFNEYLYPPGGLDELEIEFEVRGMKITLPPTAEPSVFYVLVYVSNPGSGVFEPIWYETFPGSTTDTNKVEVNATFRDPNANNEGNRYGMIVGYQDVNPQGANTFFPFTVEAGEFFIRPDAPYYIDDDTITLADLVDPEINCLDLFKATIEIFNGKIETDEGAKKVRVYPPFDVEQLGEVVKGFFQRGRGHQTMEVEAGSMVAENLEDETNRYVLLKFQDSDDAYIEEFKRDDLYSRRVDLGYGKAGTTEIENTLFEPTAERFRGNEFVGGSGLYLPVLTDNLDGRRSTKIGPRIGWHYGDVRQVDGDGQFSYKFEGVNTQSFGYVTQRPTVPRTDNSPDVPIIFAEHQFDLWRLFYRRWLSERYSLTNFEFLVYLDLQKYLSTSFRRPVGFTYGETFLLFQLTEIRDFDIRGETTTPVKMKLLEC